MSVISVRLLRALVVGLCATLPLTAAGCASSEPEPTPSPEPTVASEVVVASYGPGVPETIAALYVASLNASGIPAKALPPQDLEGAVAAIQAGEADLLAAPASELAATVVAAQATATPLPSPSATVAETRSLDDELAKLRSAMTVDGVAVLAPAAAVDGVMFVMRRSRAAADDVTSLSDLAQTTETDPATLAAPSGCADQYTCLGVLADGYEVSVAEVLAAPWEQVPSLLLERTATVGQVDTLADDLVGLRTLVDDRSLLPPQNIVPLLVESKEAARAAIEGVQAELTTADLREFAGDLAAGQDPNQIADSWITLRFGG
jgi:glycine betaine/choline ABC-type transport system substrate-binding protein